MALRRWTASIMAGVHVQGAAGSVRFACAVAYSSAATRSCGSCAMAGQAAMPMAAVIVYA